MEAFTTPAQILLPNVDLLGQPEQGSQLSSLTDVNEVFFTA
jgi:hypothetical protein